MEKEGGRETIPFSSSFNTSDILNPDEKVETHEHGRHNKREKAEEGQKALGREAPRGNFYDEDGVGRVPMRTGTDTVRGGLKRTDGRYVCIPPMRSVAEMTRALHGFGRTGENSDPGNRMETKVSEE